jgi:hypothetical protein
LKRLVLAWDQHETKARDDGVERILWEVKLLGIHDPCRDIAQPFLLGETGCNVQHLRGNVGRQDASLEANQVRCVTALVTGAGGDIQDPIARLELRSLEHLVRCTAVELLP